MPRLHIAFEEGFDGDAVVALVSGREVFRQRQVKTRRQIGYAAAVEVDVDAGPVTVEVTLPSREISGQLVVAAENTPYVGVSITGATPRFRVSATPFGYA